MAKAHQAYLLVYHSRPWLPDDRWLDQSNDPELRVAPMTWGICRTNVRRWASVGTDLFFLAFPDGGRKLPIEERYYLGARFHVAELIGHDKAVWRFPRRPNMLLDHLPLGPSLTGRLRAYLAEHVDDLAWPEKEQVRHDLALSSCGIVDERPDDYLVSIHGVTYVHAYWDHHADWRERLRAPYVVADTVESRVLQTPISYAQCAAECRSLPRPEHLQSPHVWRHGARKLEDESVAYLIARMEAVPVLRPTSGMAASIARSVGNTAREASRDRRTPVQH
jgi:hypothetical protein